MGVVAFTKFAEFDGGKAFDMSREMEPMEIPATAD